MLQRLSPTTSTGLLFGLLFFLHAAVPDSHAWPMLWPTLAGGTAVYFAMQESSRRGFFGSLGLGAKAGIVAGVVFLIATVPMLYVVRMPSLEPVARALGADGAVSLSPSVVLMLAATGLVGGLLCGVVGSALAHPLLKRRTTIGEVR